MNSCFVKTLSGGRILQRVRLVLLCRVIKFGLKAIGLPVVLGPVSWSGSGVTGGVGNGVRHLGPNAICGRFLGTKIGNEIVQCGDGPPMLVGGYAF